MFDRQDTYTQAYQSDTITRCGRRLVAVATAWSLLWRWRQDHVRGRCWVDKEEKRTVGKPEPTCQQLAEKAAQAWCNVGIPVRHEFGDAYVLCRERPALSASWLAGSVPAEGESVKP
jgi:hypothetical protein